MTRFYLGRKREKLWWAAIMALFLLVIYQIAFLLIPKSPLGFKDKPFRTVHLDLKGAPPLLNYLRVILPILASAGCDSLLIEYEDMFPYTGKLENLSARNSYTWRQIKTLLSWAHDLNMEVIPLVQTFGHLEFALKLEEWQHLREEPTSPQELCPSKHGSMELIEEMIRQVMLLHKGIKYLHIGADEVFHLGDCVQCRQRAMSSRELFIDHITRVAEHIHSNYPGVMPIIWDDMLRKSAKDLLSTKLPELVEPMIWCYSRNVPSYITTHVMYWYTKAFKRIWIAGAFKGATHASTLLPDTVERLSNQISWVQFLSNYDKSNIVGYVLTGWSRFDHFAVLCEMLPSSLPSLLLNLHFVYLICQNQTIDEDMLYKKWRSSIFCPSNASFTPFNLQAKPTLMVQCQFPGVTLYEITVTLIDIKAQIKSFIDLSTNGWLTEYNVRHNYTNAWRLESHRARLQIMIKNIEDYKTYTELILGDYFDYYTIKEWTEQNFEPHLVKLSNLEDSVIKVSKRHVWQRRPID